MVLQIEEPRAATSSRNGFALFRLGFRPFFLFGPIFSILALGYFILWMSGLVSVYGTAMKCFLAMQAL